jgi:uncharacterized MAPEG superfamily protein
MTPELTALTLSALLQMVQFVLYALPANLELGTRYTMSPRDKPMPRPLSTLTGRLQRAMNNHFEGLILFAIAVAVVTLAGKTSAFTAACAWTFLAARILYVPAYALGLVPWRSVIWAVGWFATLFLLVASLV